MTNTSTPSVGHSAGCGHGYAMTSVPRDPGHYWPSEHATIRKRRRGITWDMVSTAIAEGDVTKDISNAGNVLFITDNVTVAANPESGCIATVAKGKPDDLQAIDP